MITGGSRTATWDEIENEFGPLVEIPPKADGDWDTAAIHEARMLNLLWARVKRSDSST